MEHPETFWGRLFQAWLNCFILLKLGMAEVHSRSASCFRSVYMSMNCIYFSELVLGLSPYEYVVFLIWITIIKIRQSHERLIFMIGIPIHGKIVFILRQGSVSFPQYRNCVSFWGFRKTNQCTRHLTCAKNILAVACLFCNQNNWPYSTVPWDHNTVPGYRFQ